MKTLKFDEHGCFSPELPLELQELFGPDCGSAFMVSGGGSVSLNAVCNQPLDVFGVVKSDQFSVVETGEIQSNLATSTYELNVLCRGKSAQTNVNAMCSQT